ncbi:MAG: TIGR01777 family protein [Dehalococcoidia bacterium]|nr:TIGR01777 family protein [Dehalococcoidia bacterium]MBK8559524.1 TIGR01777 family protein [Dehalococcoidia bacterium]MBK9545942.1 TIGR01777 family protein [Dehalococcoidia bacterium]
MRVAITGASGLIGTALAARLKSEGHDVRPLKRGAAADWDPATGWIRPGALEGIDAVVHLAGESIGKGRWSPKRKQELRSSRIDSTRLLVSEISKMASPPVFVAASAIGYYGNREDEVLDETSARGEGFLADLVRDWEAESLKAEDAGARTVLLRFGVILAKEGGALPQMMLPFKFGAGGRLGSGRQWFSWVALEDAVSILIRSLTTDMSGVYNVTAPEPVTNRELTKALSKVLKRPAIFPVPPFALRIVLGESANELLLAGQRVLPRRLLDAGYSFRQTEISTALESIVKGS